MSPEDIAKKGYADFMRGDIAAVLQSLDENIEWITPDIGMSPGGTYKGHAGVAQFFQQVGEAWEFQAFEPKQYIASANQVVACGSYTMTARSTGRQGSCDWAMVWTIGDGKVVRFQEYTDSALLKDLLTARASA